jgi:hypothetical protein
MIDDGAAAYFLSRPRRFGKSLIASTLRALFTGQKEFFKGLAIEERLDEELFAARPVIVLDMTLVTNYLGIEEFQGSLGRMTSSSAIWPVDGSPIGGSMSLSTGSRDFKRETVLPPGEILSNLISDLSKRSGLQVAVLIDEYDKPYLDLIEKPDEAEKVRVAMRDYYTRLKTCDEYISFIVRREKVPYFPRGCETLA